MTKINPEQCPVCGQNNQCQEAKNASACQNSTEACWCFTTDLTFTPELLAQVPAALQNKACICQRCAELANGLVN